MGNIVVVAEHRRGHLRSAGLSALSFGKEMAAGLGIPWHILVVGRGVSSVAEEAARYGASSVLVADRELLEHPLAQASALVVAAATRAVEASFIVAPVTPWTKDFLPRVAARLNAGMASDVIAFEIEGSAVAFQRAMYAGAAVASVVITTAVQIVSARPTAFPKAKPEESLSPLIPLSMEIDPTSTGAKFLSYEDRPSERPELTEAEIVVAGGRGTRGREGFELLEEFADLLGAALGASRAAVDVGWVPADFQIGQTGKIVAPNIYFAIGISGAIQHVAGMKDSKVIVVINKDPDAPIFQIATYGLVADLFVAVPALNEAIKKVKET
ncbi:MAG: electron transfer flavoprotein subunit alpha/FixB family protein [Candidatus Methylomirabilales bacterium]